MDGLEFYQMKRDDSRTGFILLLEKTVGDENRVLLSFYGRRPYVSTINDKMMSAFTKVKKAALPAGVVQKFEEKYKAVKDRINSLPSSVCNY